MAEVEIISTSLVGAAAAVTAAETSSNNGVSRIELTPWDLQFLPVGPIQKGLLFHKPTPQQQQLIHNHLKTTLSSTLAFFPPLAGRFATEIIAEDNTSSVFIDCNNAGVEFVEARAIGVTVAAILYQSPKINLPQILRSFFPLNGILNRDGIYKPLMGVQITELLDGYFIGCTLNHTLGDGTCFWNFLNSWSELSRGGFHQPSLTPPIFQQRFFPHNITPPIHLPPIIENNEIFTPPMAFPERVFHLSKESISKLKEKANSEMGTNNSSISSLQSYLAHLWRCVTRARDLDSNEDVHLFIIIGARPRMDLPDNYWGNAAYFRNITAKAGEVIGKGLGWVAWQINETVQKQSRKEIMNQYMSLVKSPAALIGPKKFPANTLAISSSPRFNVYGNDFGWGPPVAVRSGGGNKIDGKVTLFGGSVQGSVDIELCIHPHILFGLENDQEFLEYFTISRKLN